VIDTPNLEGQRCLSKTLSSSFRNIRPAGRPVFRPVLLPWGASLCGTELNFLERIFATAAAHGKLPLFNRGGTIAGMEPPDKPSVRPLGITADGDANRRTTKPTLVFDNDIPGLSAADIELTAGEPARAASPERWNVRAGAVRHSRTITVSVGFQHRAAKQTDQASRW
jgi:hypothetical protein